MRDVVRGPALARLRQRLFRLQVEARLAVAWNGRGRQSRFFWPLDEERREGEWEDLAAELYSREEDGVVIIAPCHAPRSERQEFAWPAAGGLFDSGEEPGKDARVKEADEAQEEELARAPPARQPPAPRRPALPHVPGLETNKVTLRPEKASIECATQVLIILYRFGRRMTAPELEKAMERFPKPYGSSAIAHTLSWLRHERKLIDHATDGKGRGYGLMDWSRPPCLFEGQPVCEAVTE